MTEIIKGNIDYSQPVEVADGIYWVGYADDNAGLHCNPYLIVDGDEAVLIDAGSRNDFSIVMTKILQTGVNPNSIERLIYQHYDPDLCGSVPHFETLIKNDNLKVLSHRENNIFINYYASVRPKECIETRAFKYTFRSGRELSFIKTPYSHSPGSFMTYDHKTKTLFSSDIFGSYDRVWELFLEMHPTCDSCNDVHDCHISSSKCPIVGILDFHRRVMTSTKALNYALDAVDNLDVGFIAPQHGCIITNKIDKDLVMKELRKLDDIGIDGLV